MGDIIPHLLYLPANLTTPYILLYALPPLRQRVAKLFSCCKFEAAKVQ